MKFVYVLTSSIADTLTEQALLSAYSLRLHNPEAHAVLLTDRSTFDSLTGGRARIKEYIDEIKIIDTPEGFTSTEKSRFLKTSLPEHIAGDFLYIDIDTVITGNLAELSAFEADIAAVVDVHKIGETNFQFNVYKKKTKKKIEDFKCYFNTGVLRVKDSPKAKLFFRDWHALWLAERERYNIRVDQPTFLQTNLKHGQMIGALPDIYNCQIHTSNSLPFRENAKIVHYFASLDDGNFFFPLMSRHFLLKIREKGITKLAQAIIEAPVEYIFEGIMVNYPQSDGSYMQPMEILGRKLSRDFPSANKIASFIYRIFGYKI